MPSYSASIFRYIADMEGHGFFIPEWSNTHDYVLFNLVFRQASWYLPRSWGGPVYEISCTTQSSVIMNLLKFVAYSSRKSFELSDWTDQNEFELLHMFYGKFPVFKPTVIIW